MRNSFRIDRQLLEVESLLGKEARRIDPASCAQADLPGGSERATIESNARRRNG